MREVKILLLFFILLLSSCSKDETMICGTVTGGDYDAYNNMYYLRVDGKRHWVDMKTWESFVVGEWVCLNNF